MTKIIVAHPDDDILFFMPEILKADKPSIFYVFKVSRLREIGVSLAHIVAGIRAPRLFLRRPWDSELSLDLDGEEVWTHDPNDYLDHTHHWLVARAVLEGAKGRVRLFTGYSLPSFPRSVYGWSYVRKAVMWRIYSLFDSSVRHLRTNPFHAQCIGRCRWTYA